MKIDMSQKFSTLFEDFDNFEKSTVKMAKIALYWGADTFADEIRKSYNNLPIAQKKNGKMWWGTEDHPVKGVTEKQKKDILNSFGVSQHHVYGEYVEVSIGVNGDGYTEGYYGTDNRLPIPLLLRQLESGTSWMEKHPIIRPAVNRVREHAVKEMQKHFTKAVREELYGG